MGNVRVEIITPVFNRCEDTLRCLRSIANCDLEGIDAHMIIVDDGSTDATAERVKEAFPDVEIVRGDGTLWYTGGTNLGLESALRHNPDYILAINNDQVFDGNCIRRMVECAERYPRSVVGSLLCEWDVPHKIFQVSPRWELMSGGYRHWFRQTVWTVPQKPWEVEIIVGNCVLYPAQAVREVGLMNALRFPQYGDAEYTPRMKRRGWKLIIEPRARVFCKPNDEVSGFRGLSLRSKMTHLFLKTTGPYSLKRRFNMTMAGAPNTLYGLLALPIFFIRLFIGRNAEGSWALAQAEPPLAETFASAVLDD